MNNDNDFDGIYDLIKKTQLVEFLSENVQFSPWPNISKSYWKSLGDMIRLRETTIDPMIDSSKWISVRLDIRGFSRKSKLLFPEKKYNDKFGKAMTNTMYALMEETNACYGFSQSDEITIIINPHYNEKTETFSEHNFGGRHDKICTLSASFASVVLLQQLLHFGLWVPGVVTNKPIVQFDARIGTWDSAKDAFKLILWRAYDCNINGVSDAIYKSKLDNRKQLLGLSTIEKVHILHNNGLLPLDLHQGSGTFLQKKKVHCLAINKLTGNEVQVERGKICHIQGNVLNNIRNSSIVIE